MTADELRRLLAEEIGRLRAREASATGLLFPPEIARDAAALLAADLSVLTMEPHPAFSRRCIEAWFRMYARVHDKPPRREEDSDA